MAGTLINDYSNSDSNILAMQSTLDKTFFAKSAGISITNFETSTVPAIAAGSIVEVGGGLYQFASEEAISTTDPVTSATVADGKVYICLIPSSGTITAAFTATAPTWSDAKQNWYGTVAQAANKYLPFYMTKSSTTYSDKYIFDVPKIDWYAVPSGNQKTIIRASLTSDLTSTGSPYDDIIYDVEQIDLNSEYDTSTGVFTVTRPGYYELRSLSYATGTGSGAQGVLIVVQIDTGGGYSPYSQAADTVTLSSETNSIILEDVVYLNDGDKVKFSMFSASTAIKLLGSTTTTSFGTYMTIREIPPTF